MKWNSGDDTPVGRFDDEVTALLDGASNELTLAEMVGVLGLQVHILKNRMTLPPMKCPNCP